VSCSYTLPPSLLFVSLSQARGGHEAHLLRGQYRSGDRRLSRLLDLALSELSKLSTASAADAGKWCERMLRAIKADRFVREVVAA